MNIKITSKQGKELLIENIKKYSFNENNTKLTVTRRVPGTRKTKISYYDISKNILKIEAL
jgi:hypothetical protein